LLLPYNPISNEHQQSSMMKPHQRGCGDDMAEPRLELKPGVLVIASDGSCGTLQQLFVHAAKRRVVALVVQRDQPFSRPVIVPLTQVAAATSDEIRLHISHSQMAVLPRFYPRCYSVVGKGRDYGLGKVLNGAPHSHGSGRSASRMLSSHLNPPVQGCTHESPLTAYVLVRMGQRMLYRDGGTDHMLSLLVKTCGRIQHFVVQHGRFFKQTFIVPTDRVEQFGPQGIQLSIRRAARSELLIYRSDRDIAADIEHALWQRESLPEIDHRAIEIIVHNGMVNLRGYVLRPGSRDLAGRVAQATRGVSIVENHLIADGEVVCAVSQALARDPRTRGHPVWLHVERGFVFLNGAVPDRVTHAAVANNAGSVPLVRGVINQVCAPGIAVEAERARVLQPPIGREVYGLDMQLGHVERVMINPVNRLVTALVVHGGFPDLEATNRRLYTDDAIRHERRVVIPVTAVRTITDGAVLLDIDGKTAARYTDVTTANYVAPDAGWQPPHPYRWHEILVAQEHIPPDVDAAAAMIQPPLDALEYGGGARPLAEVVMGGT
jgi:osmotically-inducible protein OsmY/sporulation protein YlmC with PRC-barrel domain